MSNREFLKQQIDILPDKSIDKITEFINYQKFLLGFFENDDEYLKSIPNMEKSIMDGLNTPLSNCYESLE